MIWRNWWRRLALASLVCLACQALGAPRAGAKHGKKPRNNAAKVECKQSAERAQQLRMDGKLLDARDELHACLRPACPTVVRSYCTRWFEEVEAAIPSVVLKVRDAQENDLRDVTVIVDGERNDEWREGIAIDLDPGEHQLAFHRLGSESETARVLLGPSEKNRMVTVTMRPALTLAVDEPHEAFTPEPQVDDVPRDRRATRMRRAAWATLGVSALSIGTFAALGAVGKRDLDALEASCSGSCPQAEVDAAWTKLIAADVALGLAVASAGVSTWLFVASRRGDTEREPPAHALSVAPHEHGLFGTFRTRF